jgi:hypothetical protein
MVKVFDISTMAYYDFKDGRSNVLDDAMRNQWGTVILAKKAAASPPVLMYDLEKSNPFCDSLDRFPMDVLPLFGNISSSYESGLVPFENFIAEEVRFEYTFSMWLKNEGGHQYTSQPELGADNYHFFHFK